MDGLSALKYERQLSCLPRKYTARRWCKLSSSVKKLVKCPFPTMDPWVWLLVAAPESSYTAIQTLHGCRDNSSHAVLASCMGDLERAWGFWLGPQSSLIIAGIVRREAVDGGTTLTLPLSLCFIGLSLSMHLWLSNKRIKIKKMLL